MSNLANSDYIHSANQHIMNSLFKNALELEKSHKKEEKEENLEEALPLKDFIEKRFSKVL